MPPIADYLFLHHNSRVVCLSERQPDPLLQSPFSYAFRGLSNLECVEYGHQHCDFDFILNRYRCLQIQT